MGVKYEAYHEFFFIWRQHTTRIERSHLVPSGASFSFIGCWFACQALIRCLHRSDSILLSAHCLARRRRSGWCGDALFVRERKPRKPLCETEGVNLVEDNADPILLRQAGEGIVCQQKCNPPPPSLIPCKRRSWTQQESHVSDMHFSWKGSKKARGERLGTNNDAVRIDRETAPDPNDVDAEQINHP